MRRFLPVLMLLSACTAPAGAHGLLIPEDTSLPPLAMVNHRVTIAIEDQVAVTKVEQSFRNHTDRQLEATYVFPVPKGASVNNFTMWVNGKEVRGEMVEADKARQIYTQIVQPDSGPGPARIHGQQPAAPARLPHPAQERSEGDDELHVGRVPRRWRRRVHLSAQDRRQGHEHA